MPSLTSRAHVTTFGRGEDEIAANFGRPLIEGFISMTLPAPLADRAGHLGGIESITIDGKRWYFGFDYSSDLVVSPLIEDPAQMAEFAAQHMEQKGGSEDVTYWRKLVDWSVEGSELASHPGDRDFQSAAMARIATDVNAAVAGNTLLPGLQIPYHMLYLLSAAVGDVPPPDDPAYGAALAKAGLGTTESPIGGACGAMDMLSGVRELADGATYADAAVLIRICLGALVSRAPGNWRTMFQGLAPV